ncbi:uncharacterized protein [Ptychodera flava]|uniref:uncharacterized protein n=1 Tax=Ptychodera flava TaxID=63121 RepID=UPI00396A709C
MASMNNSRVALNWTSAANATSLKVGVVYSALRVTQIVFLSVVLLSSLVLNCFDLIMLLRSRRRKTPIYLMQTNLVLVDSLITAIIMPSNLYYLVVDSDVLPVYCQLSGCLRYTCLFLSLFSEASIAVMRQMAVACPYGFRNNIRRPRVLKMLLCLWTSGLLFGLLPILVKETRYSMYNYLSVCDIDTPTGGGGTVMMTTLVVVGAFFPVVTMAVCYLWLLFSLSKHNTVVIVGSNNAGAEPEKRQVQMRPRKVILHMKARGVIFAILAKVFILLAPFSVVTLMASLASGRTASIFGVLSIWLLYINSAINPIAYGFLNKQLRHDFYEYLKEYHPVTLGVLKTTCLCCCSFPEKDTDARRSASAMGLPYGVNADNKQQIMTISEKVVVQTVLPELPMQKNPPIRKLVRQCSSTLTLPEKRSSWEIPFETRSKHYVRRQSTLSSSSRSSSFSIRRLSRQKRMRSSESYSPESRPSNMPDLINNSDSVSQSSSRRDSLKSHFSVSSLGNRARRLSQSTRSRLKSSLSRSKSEDRHELPLLDLMSLGESDDGTMDSPSDHYRVSLQQLPEESFIMDGGSFNEAANSPGPEEVNYRSGADSVSLPCRLQRSCSTWSDRRNGANSDASDQTSLSQKRALSLVMLQQLYDSFIDIKGVTFDSVSDTSDAENQRSPPELQRTMSCGSVVVSNVFNGSPQSLKESSSPQLPGCVGRESICSTIPE